MSSDFRPQIRNGRVQLRVLSSIGGTREVVDHRIRVHPVTLDQPGAFGTVDAVLRGGRDPAVRENVRGGQPDLTPPGPGADHPAQAQAPEAFGKGLTVRRSALV